MSHESWGEATGEGTEVQRVEEASQVTQTVLWTETGRAWSILEGWAILTRERRINLRSEAVRPCTDGRPCLHLHSNQGLSHYPHVPDKDP